MDKKSIKNERKQTEKDKKVEKIEDEMDDSLGFYTEKQRETRIRKVRNHLIREYSDLNPKQNLSVESVINRMAFLSVHIEEQEKIINRDGTIEEYKNGENQFGIKDSTASKVHDRMFNDFLKAKKQLDDMKGKDAGEEDPAERILNFVSQTNHGK